jgi:hypothetical protein
MTIRLYCRIWGPLSCDYEELYSPLKVSWDFGGTCHLRLLTCYLLHAGLLLGLFFSPEDGGNIFLWNASWLSADNAAFQKIELTRKCLVGLGTYGTPMIDHCEGNWLLSNWNFQFLCSWSKKLKTVKKTCILMEFSYYRENLVTCLDARVLLQQEIGRELRTVFSIDTFSHYWTIISPKLIINNVLPFI